MSAPKFTPGPWTTDEDVEHEAVLGADGVYVADCCICHVKRTTTACRANAAFIVRACNAHDALVEALRRAEQKLGAYVGVCRGDKELTGTVLPMVSAALAKANGERT